MCVLCFILDFMGFTNHLKTNNDFLLSYAAITSYAFHMLLNIPLNIPRWDSYILLTVM